MEGKGVGAVAEGAEAVGAERVEMEEEAESEEDNHPVLQSMCEARCEDPKKIAVAFSVYLGLCEVEKLSDVCWEYNKTHEYFSIRGKTSLSSHNTEVFIPVSVNSDITPTWLENVQNGVHRNTGSRSFTLAVKDVDSTVVYYSISQGLITPDSPETSREKKKKRETRNLIESELQRQREVIYELALT